MLLIVSPSLLGDRNVTALAFFVPPPTSVAVLDEADAISRPVIDAPNLERRRKDLLAGFLIRRQTTWRMAGEDDFTVVREVRDKPSLVFPIRDHHDLGTFTTRAISNAMEMRAYASRSMASSRLSMFMAKESERIAPG